MLEDRDFRQENDTVDLLHAVVHASYAELVVLDGKWASAIEQATKRIRRIGYTASIARPFSPRNQGIEAFLSALEAWPMVKGDRPAKQRQSDYLELLMTEKSDYKGKMMGMEYTPDDAVLAEMGKVTIRHSFLDWTLNRTIKTMTDMTPQQADFAFASEPSASLRRKVIRVAKHCFGKDSETFRRVDELMKRCETVTRQRNRYTHNLWLSLEGKAVLLELAEQDRHMAPPTAAELRSLADAIRELYAEINSARMKGGGFLHEAVHKLRAEKRLASQR